MNLFFNCYCLAGFMCCCGMCENPQNNENNKNKNNENNENILLNKIMNKVKLVTMF